MLAEFLLHSFLGVIAFFAFAYLFFEIIGLAKPEVLIVLIVVLYLLARA